MSSLWWFLEVSPENYVNSVLYQSIFLRNGDPGFPTCSPGSVYLPLRRLWFSLEGFELVPEQRPGQVSILIDAHVVGHNGDVVLG